jgi:hypothetical protein
LDKDLQKRLQECSRKCNNGIESIIIQIALQIVQQPAKYLSLVLIFVDMTFYIYNINRWQNAAKANGILLGNLLVENGLIIVIL